MKVIIYSIKDFEHSYLVIANKMNYELTNAEEALSKSRRCWKTCPLFTQGPNKVDRCCYYNAMTTCKEQYVNLKHGMPVFLAYFTSWVDNNRKLNFRKDVYGRDKALKAMMHKL